MAQARQNMYAFFTALSVVISIAKLPSTETNETIILNSHTIQIYKLLQRGDSSTPVAYLRFVLRIHSYLEIF